MENALQVFNYNDKQVRTVEQDGEIWFVAKDVCNILEISKYRDAVSKLEDDERCPVKVDTLQGMQEMAAINEPGLYALILRSNKPEAKAFSRWVRHEVLPQIRQHGMYLTDKLTELLKTDPAAFDKLLTKYMEECKKSQALEKKLASEQPFTNLGHVVLALPGSITVQEAAHFLAQFGFDIGQNRLYKKCRENGLLGKRKGKQYNQPTQRAIERGLFNAEINGGFKSIAMVTPKGLSNFIDMLTNESYPLLVLLEGCEEDGRSE